MKQIENAEDERFSDAKMHSDYHNSTFKTCFDTFCTLLKKSKIFENFQIFQIPNRCEIPKGGGLDEVKSTTKKHQDFPNFYNFLAQKNKNSNDFLKIEDHAGNVPNFAQNRSRIVATPHKFGLKRVFFCEICRFCDHLPEITTVQ